jgi:DNA-binding SARP family transcriptional activator
MTGDDSPRIIRSKLRPPEPSDHVVARPRIEQRLRDLIERHAVVVVSATAGSGKTTAVTRALAGDGRLAWLTLDDRDVAPGRLLTYLEAALAERVPDAAGVATGALAARASHAETAGLLADSTDGHAVVLAIDEVERLGDSAGATTVLNALLLYVPASMRIVLLSRRDVQLELTGRGLPDAVAVVGEHDLAFTEDEAQDALARVSESSVEAADAVAATGGWVTGVLFEAWRSADHVAGAGGEADPLHGYLATQILDRLEPPERELLIRTSPLRRVDPESARRLGVANARRLLEGLRSYHLPVAWEADGSAMRCHPRFREYLVELLERRDDGTAREIRRRHADLLSEWGLFEEATDEYLAAGAMDAALATADRAIGRVVERIDLDVAERWLEHLPAAALPEHPGLLTATMVVALGREEFARGARAADELRAAADKGGMGLLPPRTMSMMAWLYFLVGRLDASREVADAMPPGPERRAVSYQLTWGDDEPAPERDDPPRATGSPLDALLMRAHYVTGRLRAVRDAPPTRWGAALSAPWRIEAKRAMGQLDTAYRHYRSALEEDARSKRLETIIGPELLGDLGRVDDALSALQETRPIILEAGCLIWEVQSLLLEARLRLRFDVDRGQALAVLESLAARPEVARYAFAREQIAAWTGLARLHRGEDEAALSALRDAVDSMQAGRRILELPAAAVYLSEAAWRLDAEDEADAAADLALEAARQQGSNHLLLQALSDFPAVLARRLDAEPGADSRWHDLGRVLSAQPSELGGPLAGSIRFHDFGAPQLVVNGEVVRSPITKSLEVLAVLADAPDHRADRTALLTALFNGRSDHSSRTYLRQAVHRLRELMPEGVELILDGEQAALEGATVVSDSARFERMLDEAGRLGDAERLDALQAALELYGSGEYLAGRDSMWIEERRMGLAERAVAARFDAAELSFALGDHRTAQTHVDAVLAADPYRESAWRLAMRVAAGYGDADRAVEVFRRCARTLAQVGIEPAPSTRELLQALRR